jgi:hypothetical protein
MKKTQIQSLNLADIKAAEKLAQLLQKLNFIKQH